MTETEKMSYSSTRKVRNCIMRLRLPPEMGLRFSYGNAIVIPSGNAIASRTPYECYSDPMQFQFRTITPLTKLSLFPKLGGNVKLDRQLICTYTCYKVSRAHLKKCVTTSSERNRIQVSLSPLFTFNTFGAVCILKKEFK